MKHYWDWRAEDLLWAQIEWRTKIPRKSLDKSMSIEFLKEVNIIRVSNAVTAGTSAVTSSVVDMQGYDAIAFVCALGTVTDASVLTLTSYENTASSTSGGTTVTAGATSAVTSSGGGGQSVSGSNATMVTDVIRPSKRYCYCQLTRTAQNAAVDAIYAFQYRCRNAAVTQSSSVMASASSTPEN